MQPGRDDRHLHVHQSRRDHVRRPIGCHRCRSDRHRRGRRWTVWCGGRSWRGRRRDGRGERALHPLCRGGPGRRQYPAEHRGNRRRRRFVRSDVRRWRGSRGCPNGTRERRAQPGHPPRDRRRRWRRWQRLEQRRRHQHGGRRRWRSGRARHDRRDDRRLRWRGRRRGWRRHSWRRRWRRGRDDRDARHERRPGCGWDAWSRREWREHVRFGRRRWWPVRGRERR